MYKTTNDYKKENVIGDKRRDDIKEENKAVSLYDIK